MKILKVIRFIVGIYDLYVGVFMNIKVVGIEFSLLCVDFYFDYMKLIWIIFDCDYFFIL